MAPTNSTHIDNGFYRISDRLAGKLAKSSPIGRLPADGMESRVTHEGARWWLTRTPLRFRNDSPARGWVWALHGKH